MGAYELSGAVLYQRTEHEHEGAARLKILSAQQRIGAE